MTVPVPEPPRRTAGRPTFVIWAIAVGVIITFSQLGTLLDRLRFPTTLLTIASFFAWLVVIAISLYWITIAIRWTMRRLFWRVGRRLFLSYVLIGALPFLLVTVLLLAVGYMIAGVMSHAALRGERQATLGQMESWALEYGLTGRKPSDRLPSLEIYDTTADSGEGLPDWLRQTTVSGVGGGSGGGGRPREERNG